MQKQTVGFLFIALLAPGLAAAEPVWSGGAGLRRLVRKLDDGLQTKDANGFDTSKQTNQRYEYRATLGVSGKGESVDWGFDVRTQPAGTPTTEWVSNTTGADLGVGLAQAYGRWHTKFADTDMALTFGRAKTVIVYDNIAQNLFDNDVRWDGFGWAFKHGDFGFNATQYVLGGVSRGTVGSSSYSYNDSSMSNANTQSHFAMLYSFQPWIELKLSEEIKTKLAVGWHKWAGTGANTAPTPGTGFFSNAVHGGTANSTAGVAVGNVNPVIVDNASQWQVFADTSLPYQLRVVGEVVWNKKTFYGTRENLASPTVEASRTAWSAGVVWGKSTKANDVSLSYAYAQKGIASVVGLFTNGDVAPDNKSHFLEGRYYYADNVWFTAKAQFHKELAQLGGDGQPLAAPNNNRLQTVTRYELVTTIQL